MRYYVALLHHDESRRYRIEFPDFPGCVAWSDALDESARIGARVLAQEIGLRLTAGEPVPRPCQPEAAALHADMAGAVPILVPAPALLDDRVTVNLDLPAGLVERVDRRARVSGVERGDLFERAARLALWETGRAERATAAVRAPK